MKAPKIPPAPVQLTLVSSGWLPSNTTAEDEYKLTGKISGDRALECLKALDIVEALDSEFDLTDIKANQPDEDALHEVLDELHCLAKVLRGKGKDALCHIIEMLEEVEKTQNQNTEYVLDEIKQLEKKLDEIFN